MSVDLTGDFMRTLRALEFEVCEIAEIWIFRRDNTDQHNRLSLHVECAWHLEW